MRLKSSATRMPMKSFSMNAKRALSYLAVYAQ